jgi:carboxymethylenebutenolidase
MNYFQKYLVDEFAEDYQEGLLTRRQALKLIASVTGSTLIASTILAACAPPPAEPGTPAAAPTTAPTDAPPPATAQPSPTAAQPTANPTPTASPAAAASATPLATSAGTAPASVGTVSPDDPAIQAGEVTFPGDQNENLLGYLARPASNEARPVVLVCHENRGLTAHIQDVTRRLAKAGYVGLAVDLLSRQGGTAAVSEDAVPGALSAISPDQYIQDFRSGWIYLGTQAFAQAERVGMVGFCYGGGVTWLVATKMPELKAAVPFYGPIPPLTEVVNIQAAVLGIYGGLDTRITGSAPAIEEEMKKNNKTYDKMIYPNANHAFHNDTGTRYDPEAAQDAWKRTLAWFTTYL